MAEAKENSKHLDIVMPTEKREQTIQVSPHDTINLTGIDFSKVKVDIVDGNVIFLDPQSGGKIVFPGLALILFDPKDAPTLTVNGSEISANQLLGKLGVVGNVNEEQFLSFSTLDASEKAPDPNDKKNVEVEKELQETKKALEEAIQERDEAVQMAMMNTPKTEQEKQQAEEIEERKKYDHKYDSEDSMPQNDFTSNKTDSSSASSSAAAEEPASGTDDNPSIAFFGFKVFLLQPNVTTGMENVSGVPTSAVYGGGGSQTSTFNPSNESQFSTEIIDYSTSTQNLVVYAESPTNYSPTSAARVIEISATTPDGFSITDGAIRGLPAGYSIEGATLQPDGSYVVDTFTTNERGDVQLVLKYPVPSSDAFEIEVEFTATFDPNSGFPAPTLAVQTFSVKHPVEVHNVDGPEDLNYVDADGNLVWVLSNQTNANTILTGSGADIIHGGTANDSIQTGSGDDYIYSSAGNDTISGGAGSDTVDYSLITENININLSSLVGGYSQATIGSLKVDQLVGIENIIAGSGNDTLVGDASDNILRGGAGNDVLNGGLGNDILDGGDGLDSISFQSGATSGLTLDLAVALTGATINVGTGTKTLISIENIIATDFADTITDGTGNNIISGAGGADTFIANGGINSFDGGYNGSDNSTADLIDYSRATTGVTLNLGGTTNSDGFVTATVGSWATDLIKGIEYVTGSAFADTITGNAADNILRGGAGNDTLNGAGGNDTIYGGTGSDTLDGGIGTNILRFDDLTGTGINFTLSSATAGTAVQGGDTDTFTNFQTYYMTEQADTIRTSSAADTIFALGGDDLFYGSAGNDALDGGTGANTINYSGLAAGSALTATLNSSAATSFTMTISGSVTGSQTLTNIQSIIGTAGDDVFTNGTSNNIVDGGAGNNTFSYGSSAISFDMSVLTGGYFTVTSGSETDLLANFRTINGSSAADTMRGNASANIFNGLGGDDVFRGSKGGDTYDGGTGVNSIDYSAVSVDTSYITGNLTSIVIHYADSSTSTDTLTNIQNITTTSGADVITGSSADNVFFDFGGADTFVGGGGNDTINYSLLTGRSVTVDLANSTANDGVSTDSLTGFTHVVGTNLNDVLIGNSSANTISGGQGDDQIYGGGGNDTLNGNEGNDTLFGEGGSNTYDGGIGIDTISYVGASSGVTINFATGTTGSGQNGYSGTDTIVGNSVEGFIGSNFTDSVTVGSTTTSVSTGLGDDTIFSATGVSSRVINGGGGIDTVNYTGRAALSGTIENGNGTITQGANNETLSSIEKYVLGVAGDTISIDTNSIVNVLKANTGSFDSAGGTDTISIFTGTGGNLTTADGGAGIDGATLASIFRNTEQFDFRSTDITGADKFDLNNTQIASINSAKTLTILIDGTNITFADFNITGTGHSVTNPDATHQTHTWADGTVLNLQVA